MSQSHQRRQPARCYNARHFLALTVYCCTLLCPREASAFPIIATTVGPRHSSSLLYLSVEQEPELEGIGVGIDLGTTYSAIAYLKDNKVPTIISIPDNGRTMPSVVSLLAAEQSDQALQVRVGQQACQQELELGAYRNVKRVLGTGGKISRDVAKVVPSLRVSKEGKTYKKDNLLNQLHDAEHFPSMLQSTVDKDTFIPPEVISSHILQILKQAAETETGQPVTRAVVGVPAYFNDAQRQATVKAAELAGITKVKLLREPEAAALAYGMGKMQIGQGDQDELVLVFDLGGGTYDVSMLVVGGGVTEIISTSGNVKLGGSDFDARVARYMHQVLQDNGASMSRWSADARNAILRSAEVVRIFLSNNRRVDLALPLREADWKQLLDASDVIVRTNGSAEPAPDDALQETHALCQLSRREMELLFRDEIQSLLRPIREVAIMAGALLPGDSSPTMVEAAMEMEEEDQAALTYSDFYEPGDESKGASSTDISPELLLELQDTDVKATKKAQQRGRKRARDVSKQERKFREEKRKVQEKFSSQQQTGDSNVKIRDGITGRPISQVVLVGGATRMPVIGRLLAALTGVVPQKTVNPDEAVALGCAVHAGVLDGVQGMGTVLSPMQAAILRAVAQQEGMMNDLEGDFDDNDDEEFVDVEYYN